VYPDNLQTYSTAPLLLAVSDSPTTLPLFLGLATSQSIFVGTLVPEALLSEGLSTKEGANPYQLYTYLTFLAPRRHKSKSISTTPSPLTLINPELVDYTYRFDLSISLDLS
jgi:hypothetical protein